MSKYGNRQVSYDGHLFASIMEQQRYLQLTILVRAGDISDLRVHPSYVLQPGYYSRSQRRKIPAITYAADFEYVEEGKRVVEDVKGFRTAVFNLKRRLFEYTHPDLLFRLVECV